MQSFKSKDIPDIENPFSRQSLCDTAQEKSNIYIEWLDNSDINDTYEGHKGCYEMSCRNCILNSEDEFKVWKAHLRLTGE